jgi:hypothetical protein
MPKRAVAGEEEFAGATGVRTLPTWQVAGLSLAVLVGHAFNGLGALLFGLVAVGVIWILHRLRTNAQQAGATADLVASVPGATPAASIRVVQFTAYALIAAYTAKNIAGMALVWVGDPSTTVPEWSGPALAVTAVVLTALLVAVLPTRLLAPTATVLAALSLLVYFYVSLAVIARIASGTAPAEPTMAISPTAAPTEWGVAALLVSLAIAFAGFEIPTAANDRLQSVRRPLGIAVALVAVCAIAAWVAVNISTTELRYDAADLVMVATDLFGEAASLWLLGATIAQAVAAILVLVWGATRVLRRGGSDGPLPLVVTGALTGILALVLAFGWFDASAKLWGVAGLLLLAVYLAAAHANSRLDDSSTGAWALFALMGFVLAAALFLTGVGQGWWTVLIAVVVVSVAAVVATNSRQPGNPNSLTTP